MSEAVAAGNNNADACYSSPARAPSALTIGASTLTDSRASFSNWGNCVDWFAPGVDIRSAVFSSDLAYTNMSGTSMASPHVAGAVALFLQKYPQASSRMVADSMYAWSTKGVVTSANSAQNHLLYSLGADDTQTPQTPPPAEPAPPAEISLTAVGARFKSERFAELRWAGATTTLVDVYRNGSKIATTANDGVHTDVVNKINSATYRVCESGQAVCSGNVTVKF